MPRSSLQRFRNACVERGSSEAFQKVRQISTCFIIALAVLVSANNFQKVRSTYASSTSGRPRSSSRSLLPPARPRTAGCRPSPAGSALRRGRSSGGGGAGAARGEAPPAAQAAAAQLASLLRRGPVGCGFPATDFSPASENRGW